MLEPAIINGKPVRSSFLHPFKHSIGEEEIDEVVDTLRSEWITTGPKTFKFEEMFSKTVNSKYAIAVNSCTAALHLAIVALGIGKGDEVITTPYTFAATSEVVINENATPVFVDVEKDTYNIDPVKIEEKITDRTKAIIVVHYAGQACEMDKIMDLAEKYDLYIIEDAAHAIGSKYKDITTAEGGMITTKHGDLADKIRMLSLHGISKDAWKRYSSEGSWYYEITYSGYKYNMSDLQASIGIHQMKKLDQMQKRREEIADKYNRAFGQIPQITTPTVKKYTTHAWHLYPVQVNSELLSINRNEFIEALKAENIGTSVHFIPLHLHPYYKEKYGFKGDDFPIAESLYNNEISLPIYPKMEDKDVEDVISAVKKIINYYEV